MNNSPQTDAEFARHPVLDTQTHQDAVLRSFAAKMEESESNKQQRLREALVAIHATATAKGSRILIAEIAEAALKE